MTAARASLALHQALVLAVRHRQGLTVGGNGACISQRQQEIGMHLAKHECLIRSVHVGPDRLNEVQGVAVGAHGGGGLAARVTWATASADLPAFHEVVTDSGGAACLAASRSACVAMGGPRLPGGQSGDESVPDESMTKR